MGTNKDLIFLLSDRRVLIFPKGNNVDHLSMYLDVADSATLPYGWSRYAQFSLAVVNQIHNKYTIRKGVCPIGSVFSWNMVSFKFKLATSSLWKLPSSKPQNCTHFYCPEVIIWIVTFWCPAMILCSIILMVLFSWLGHLFNAMDIGKKLFQLHFV